MAGLRLRRRVEDGAGRQGAIDGKDITWGDTHHPALSETKGDYDGQFLFINDKANARIAVIDLRDFETKQIVVNPIFKSEHGGAFVTPNTDYVIEAAQYPAPLENRSSTRSRSSTTSTAAASPTGSSTARKGRIEPEESFALELPPYTQDLSDAGKGPSDGWSFINSFCTERYVGGIEKGRPPYRGRLLRQGHRLPARHQLEEGGGTGQGGQGEEDQRPQRADPMETAVEEGILFLVPEPKSPHGVDVTPDGKYIVVGGKLDTHATVYQLREDQGGDQGRQVRGQGPLRRPDPRHEGRAARPGGARPRAAAHPVRRQAGIAYTSLFVESQVAKWNYCEGKVLDKISVHYNIGHLMTRKATPSARRASTWSR